MLTPTLEEVIKLQNEGNLIPIYAEVPADLETPASVYLKVADTAHSFLLESVHGGETLGRYSFIGTDPYKVLEFPATAAPYGRKDPLDYLEEELAQFEPVTIDGLPRFTGGAVGYLSYEVARYFENLPTPESDSLKLPDSIYLLTDTLLVFDHLRQTIKIISHVRSNEDIETSYKNASDKIEQIIAKLKLPLLDNQRMNSASLDGDYDATESVSNTPKTDYLAQVGKIRDYIHRGDLIQAVLSQRFVRPTTADGFTIYRALRSINPSPYMYYLNLGEFQIIGASPEMLVRVEDGTIDYHPIAGTIRRGKSEIEDQQLAEKLKSDEKELAEHIMLVDLGRNDVGKVSEPGSVQVTQLMDIERYSHVMHIVSHITGVLKNGLTAYDVLRSCFPAGTVSGAPKIRAMEVLAELELDRRGPYAGTVGYFGFSGNMDTAITIRTVVLKNGTAYVQAGGGIVADSIEENEFQETQNKAAAVLQAISRAEAMLK